MNPADTSMPAAIDYLVSLAEGLPVTQQPGVLVSDGYPGPDQPADIMSIGGSTSYTEKGNQVWANLGARNIYEEYDVEVIISSYRGGTNQQEVRNAAFGIFKPFQTAFRADITLGGAVLFAGFTDLVVEQSNYQDAGQGRICTITFAVRCKQRL